MQHASNANNFSDTFARVYENAQIVAQFERAAMIVSIENKLPSYWRKHYLIGEVSNSKPTASLSNPNSKNQIHGLNYNCSFCYEKQSDCSVDVQD